MKIHIVQKGDTLWEIAKKYHVDYEELKELNSHLATPDMIMPGMKIRIPTHSKKVTHGEKTKTLPKAEQKHVPAPKKEMNKEKPMTELPKVPTFPFEPEKMLPTLEEKHTTYPTETLPEHPKKEMKKEKPKATEHAKPKHEEQVMPKTQPVEPPLPPPMHQPMMPPMEQPCFPQPQMMLPLEQPCFAHPQMLPMFTYPSPGYMPMPYPPGAPGCGCGGHGHHQSFHYGGHPPMFMPMQHQPQVYPGMMHQQQFHIRPEDMDQAADLNTMQMYPEPTSGLRNEELELYPTPDGDKTVAPIDEKEE